MSHSDRCQAKIPWVGELAARLGALCSSPPLGSHGMDCPGAGSLCGFWVTASVTWGFFFPQLIIFYCCLSENHIMQVALVVKNPLANAETQEMWVRSLGWKDPLEKETATYSSILAWRIPWTEEPGSYNP